MPPIGQIVAVLAQFESVVQLGMVEGLLTDLVQEVDTGRAAGGAFLRSENGQKVI
jgi:hypothetical protein